MGQPGYVYALINPSMPGLVKVGRTERDPTIRVSELSGVTGVATPFILIFHQAFEDCELAERHAHATLERGGRRLAANREFFETQPTTAIHAILAAPGSTTQTPKAISREPVRDQSSLLDEMLDRAEGYTHGYGDQPKDVKEGINLYLKAGKLGCAKAYLKLADIYYDGLYVKQSEAKSFEYYRMSCEMNYAPAWAKVAAIRAAERNSSGEARAWQRFFELAVMQENQDEELILAGMNFLEPRPSLKLTYSPCEAKIGDEHISNAVDFIRSHIGYIKDYTKRFIEVIRIDEYGVYNNFRGDTRPARMAAEEENLKWLSEL